MDQETTDALEQLYADCEAIYARAKDEVTFLNEKGHLQRYNASYFIRAVRDARSDGRNVTTVVASILHKTTTGFGRLEDAQRPDLMLEILVLDPRRSYYRLFGPTTREKARERLEGYEARTGDSSWRALVTPEDLEPDVEPDVAETDAAADRATSVVERIIRSTATADSIKLLYGYRCQICREVLTTPGGPYAEGAHVRPLGAPHDGPDVAGNVLCMCPNDHIRLDRGSIWIDETRGVVDSASGSVIHSLYVEDAHGLRDDCLRYHREMWSPAT